MGIRPQNPLKEIDLRLVLNKGRIMNMIDEEEKEPGKESASLGLGALFIC